MNWPGQRVEAQFIGRRKRFLADMRLQDGSVITAHCANTGSMATCMAANAPCYLTHHPDPKRKLAYSWQAIQMPDGWVGINTSRANALVREAFESGTIAHFAGYQHWQAEPKVSDHSRLDACLTGADLPALYVEVKNVTLLGDQPGLVTFPDAVTERGTKHLAEMQRLIQLGHRAMLCFCVQRNSAAYFAPAAFIDPTYAETLRVAHQSGVLILVLHFEIGPSGIHYRRPLPYTL
ncbi:MAG: DNA/RNA nuclease SfsA [Acidobacteria bacterium]|nr:DNA/RNA nuclease SfsA [Acidobacteriota bacterium]MCB9397447.1 DNA/RNA nuclease SfsA [Acidobacteriota bacterium]